MEKNLISKYVWLINTIRRARCITLKGLEAEWGKYARNNGESENFPRSTFNNWRKAIYEIFQIEIACEAGGGYGYFIRNEDDLDKGGIAPWIISTFSVSNALDESRAISDRILLENVPSGQEYLQDIIEAMKSNRVINITYRSYGTEVGRSYDVEPYCLKLFKQRWYMAARNPYYGDEGMCIYSLDRIWTLAVKDETFKMQRGWDAAKFFAKYYGVIVNDETNSETVKLKVDVRQANYLRDLPLHLSQEEEERNKEYSIFSYYLAPTYDFVQELLSHRDDVEVLSPQWLREEMAEIIERMLNKYKTNNK